MGWRKPGLLRGELANYDPEGHRLAGVVVFVVRWVAPLLILAVLVANSL